MKRIIISIIGFFFIGIVAYGQAPNWSVNENNFEHTMSFVAFLNIDGITLSSKNDKVAAFVGSECRGVANLLYVPSKDRYYAYFNVFSKNNGETLSFKVYDSAKNKVVDIAKTVKFEINQLYGSLSQAFSFANPALSSEAKLINFNFKEVNVSNKNIAGNSMTLYVNNGTNISALTPVFELSSGAKLFNKGVILMSNTNSLDFTNPITFNVLSQDESTLNQWQVSVSYSDLIFYKKDAVCYNGGVIKVQSSQNGREVQLLKNQAPHATQVLNNGVAIFSNLDVGEYVVKVNGFEKKITINLKK